MKRTLLLTLIIGFLSINCHAECSCQKKDGDWKQRMMSEKIAFLTTEIGLTPEEGQVFWPVYNQISQEKDAAMHDTFKKYKKLEEAVEAGKPEKELKVLLDDYLQALDKSRNIEKGTTEKLAKVLSVEKIAKLYLAEEHFRRHQIHKLHNRNQ